MNVQICSKCNTSFECTNEQMGCWCEDISIDLKTLENLKKEYDNCLCPTCLKEYCNIKLNK